MSNLDTRPEEVASALAAARPAAEAAVEILSPREVPLGGPRAMHVRRTLPQRQRSLIGGWCFIDHYGPDPVSRTGGMAVAPHPHTELQTVSWLFAGEIEHRDSAGHHALVRPGELNLMTAGRGISHSEVSTPGTVVLHGVQLWVALPSAARFAEPAFEHYSPDPVPGEGFTARVFLGSLLGSSAPVTGHSPLLGAEISIEAGRVLWLPANAAFEYGVLVDAGTVALNGTVIQTSRLGYLTPGADMIELRAGQDSRSRMLLLGGVPLGEQIVMWWNFISRSHDEIVRYRADWQALIRTAQGGAPGAEPGAAGGPVPDRFALPVGDRLPPIPAPPMPNAALRPRA
jgi:quercetin 2,3-dioxygenase